MEKHLEKIEREDFVGRSDENYSDAAPLLLRCDEWAYDAIAARSAWLSFHEFMESDYSPDQRHHVQLLVYRSLLIIACSAIFGKSGFEKHSQSLITKLAEVGVEKAFTTVGRVRWAMTGVFQKPRKALIFDFVYDAYDLAAIGPESFWRDINLLVSGCETARELFGKSLVDQESLQQPSNGLRVRSYWSDQESAYWDPVLDLYQAIWEGSDPNWTLQKEIALIPDEDWEKGPTHIAALIAERKDSFNKLAGTKEGKEIFNPPILDTASKKAIGEHVRQNRYALAISIAGVLEQITDFRERVRGVNSLDTVTRDRLLDFLDALATRLKALLRELPNNDEKVSEEKASKFAAWLQSYVHFALKDSKAYLSPENVAELTVPSGIILGCTGIGVLMGGATGAGAGALVGGLITGQIKPNKAVDSILKSNETPTDGN